MFKPGGSYTFCARPDWSWGLPNLLYNRTGFSRELMRSELTADNSPSSHAKFSNGWELYPPPSPLCLHRRDIVKLYLSWKSNPTLHLRLHFFCTCSHLLMRHTFLCCFIYRYKQPVSAGTLLTFIRQVSFRISWGHIQHWDCPGFPQFSLVPALLTSILCSYMIILLRAITWGRVSQ